MNSFVSTLMTRRKHIPNLLTTFRIMIVPVFVILLAFTTEAASLWAAFLFVLASFTDWLDGYVARTYDAQSILGTLLDPLADKVLVMAALVMLSAAPYEPHLPAWITVALLAREFLVTGLRSLAAVKGMVVAASESAKHKTAWTFIGIFCLIVHRPYYIFDTLIDFHRAGMVFIWIALILSIYSGLLYAVQLKKVFMDELT